MQLVIICSQITSGFHSSLARGAQINFLASNRFWGNNHKDPNHNNKNDENCTYNDYNDRLIKFIMILRNNPGKGQTGSGIYTSDGVIFIFFLKYKYTNTLHKRRSTFYFPTPHICTCKGLMYDMSVSYMLSQSQFCALTDERDEHWLIDVNL